MQHYSKFGAWLLANWYCTQSALRSLKNEAQPCSNRIRERQSKNIERESTHQKQESGADAITFYWEKSSCSGCTQSFTVSQSFLVVMKKGHINCRKAIQDEYTNTVLNTNTCCTAFSKDNICIYRILKLTQLMNVSKILVLLSHQKQQN